MNNDEFFAITTIKDPPEVASRIIWDFLNSFTYLGPKEDEPIYHFQRIQQRSGITSKPVTAAYLRSTSRTLRETARMLKQARLRKNPKLYPKLNKVLGIELGIVHDYIFRVLGERMGFGPGVLARLLVQQRIFEVDFSAESQTSTQPSHKHA